MMRRVLLAFVVLAVAGPNAVASTVRGGVNFSKEPVPTGKITIHPTSGPPTVGKIDDGAFLIHDVRPGRARVTIEAEGLPTRLATAETSGLSIDVRDDKTSYTFELFPEGIASGEVAPVLVVNTADGNAFMRENVKDRTIIVAFASLDRINDPAGSEQFEALKTIRRTHAHNKNLLILWVFTDVRTVEGNDVKWNAFLAAQGRVDYGDGPRRFIDDSKWWSTTDLASWVAISSAPRFGVSRVPANFVIGADERFAAVRVPNASLAAVTAKALGAGR